MPNGKLHQHMRASTVLYRLEELLESECVELHFRHHKTFA